MRRFREAVDPVAIRALAERARSWGYPREVGADELEGGYWYSYGDDVVLWYAWVEPVGKVMVVHLCLAPGSRGRVASRRALTGMEVLGEALGAESLVYVPGAGGGPEVAAYLGRLGWDRLDEGVLVRWLGE